MPKLKELLKNVRCLNVPLSLELEIKNLSCNSREVFKDTLFVAVRGEKMDGHDFIYEAISKGAKAVVSEKDFKCPASVIKIIVRDSGKALAVLTGNFYKVNLDKVKLIGITGTNGKTTISFLVESIFLHSNLKALLIGTLGYRIRAGRLIRLNNTTPPVLELQKLIKKTEKEKLDYIIMEVSSHALCQYRIEGLNFKAAIFSNLSRDHLDYHKNMKNYLKAKSRLFKKLSKDSLAIINKDDVNYKYLMDSTKAKVVTYSLKGKADFMAENVKLSLNKSLFSVKTPLGELKITSSLTGIHNVYNILAAVSLAYFEGIQLKDIKKGVEALEVVPGRLQKIQSTRKYNIFIDYAHTPDALEKVLKHLKKVSKPKSKIITLFGCGGDRDRGKRSKMAKAAERFSDFVILTSDNPRSEEPANILKEIECGFKYCKTKRYLLILDRKKAIEKAIKMLKGNDILLIAGKGHEDKQIFKDKSIPFSDINTTKSILRRMEKR